MNALSMTTVPSWVGKALAILSVAFAWALGGSAKTIPSNTLFRQYSMDDPSPTVDAPSKPPRRFRRTRIALSVFFGVLTVSLCVLWVRSYHTFDRIRGCLPGDLTTLIISYRGHISAVSIQESAAAGWVRKDTLPKIFKRDSGPVNPANRMLDDVPWPAPSFLGFGWMSYRYYSNMPISSAVGWSAKGLHDRSWTGGSAGFQLPYYFLTILTTACATLPSIGLSMRFSLRTMLIATTLVAVVLGLGVWLFR